MANKKYKLSDSDYWEASGVYDITEGKTQREVNEALNTAINAITPLDTTPTSGSTKGITSGAVYNALTTQTATPINPIVDPNTIEIKRFGNVVTVSIGNVVAVTGTGTWLTYFVVPVGFRPAKDTRFVARDLGNNNFYNARIMPNDGVMQINIPNGTTANAFFTVTYII